jgi:hypothetical protein
VPELEQRLAMLGAELSFPETPDLWPGIGRCLEPRRTRPRPAWRLRRVALVAAVVLLVFAGTALAVSPGLRHAVLRAFHLQGATVERVVSLPLVRAEGPLRFGRPASLAAAQRRVQFPIVEPRLLGRPGEVDVSSLTPAGEVTLIYGPRRAPRAVLLQFRGSTSPVFLEKLVGTGAHVRRVSVGGRPGLFVSGTRVVLVQDAAGNIVVQPIELRGTTLLWERGPLLLRLESGLSEADALRVARSAG